MIIMFTHILGPMAHATLCYSRCLKEAWIEFDNLTLYFIANEETQRSLFIYVFIYLSFI
jgi:hypothetical protein